MNFIYHSEHKLLLRESGSSDLFFLKLKINKLILNVIVDFCIVPLGVGISVSEYIAACQPMFKGAGLKTHMHAYGTNI